MCRPHVVFREFFQSACVPGITSNDDNSQWSMFCLFSCWAAHTETRGAVLHETHWRHHFLSHYLNTNTAFVSSSDRQTAVFWWLLKMHNAVMLRCCSLDENEGQLYLLGDFTGKRSYKNLIIRKSGQASLRTKKELTQRGKKQNSVYSCNGHISVSEKWVVIKSVHESPGCHILSKEVKTNKNPLAVLVISISCRFRVTLFT